MNATSLPLPGEGHAEPPAEGELAGEGQAEPPAVDLVVLLLCGSPAVRSHTHALLLHLAVLLTRRGARPVLWCLRERPLPPVDPAYHRDPTRHPDEQVRVFVDVVRFADALVLGTPLYHGSYSSTLKTALDNLGYDGLRGKPVGLVSNAGGVRSANQAFEHLRTVVRTMFGYATQCQIGTCRDDYTEDGDVFRLAAADIDRRCSTLTDELVELGILLRRGEGTDQTGDRTAGRA